MKVLIFGATGMVGMGVLLECLDDPVVTAVTAVGRRPCGVEHDRLEELVLDDFHDYSGREDELSGFDACFFCLGVSAAGMKEPDYYRITYELTMAAARTLVRLNPRMTFCYVSGSGTDSTEQGRMMWARIKGKTENALMELPFEACYLFRPAFIQPVRGVESSTALYRALYTVMSPLYPVWKALFPGFVTTTELVGRAMINAVTQGYPDQILENRDINILGASMSSSSA